MAELREGPAWRLGLLALALAGACSLVRAQVSGPAAKPAIAAASVRWLCRDAACRQFPQGFSSDPEHYACDVCNLWELVLRAFGLKIYSQFQNAPAWFADDYYQVRVVATAAVASRAEMEQTLVRQVLEHCLSLRVRRDATQVPGFALVIAPGGIKFHRVKKAAPPLDLATRLVHFPEVGPLATWLNQYYYGGKEYGVTRPVHDATGLKGTYDIPVRLPQPGSETNLLAVIGRLGLAVKSAPGVETNYVILHVEHLRTSCFIPSQGGGN